MCFNRYILRRHGFGDFLIPTLKGITFSCRIVRGGNFRTVVLCNGCDFAATVCIKGYCVLINCPSGVQPQFPGHPVVKVPRLCEGAVRIPAVKGVPRFGGIIRLGNGRIQFVQHFDRPCHRTAARVEIDHTRGGLRPLCVQCNTHILIIRTCAFTVAVPVAFAAHKSIIPTKENIALALGHRHVAELLAVCNLYRFCYHLAAACGVEGDCVLIGVPHRIERQRLVFGINIFKVIYLFASINGCPAYLRVARAGEQSAAQGKNIVVGFHIRHRTAGAVCAGEVNHLIVASDRKPGNIGRYGIAGFIAVPIFIRPIQLRVFRNAVRTRQPFSSGCSEALAIFHDDLNILGAITQRAAAKVKGNDLQSVRTQCVRVQDFKDGAEADTIITAFSRAHKIIH